MSIHFLLVKPLAELHQTKTNLSLISLRDYCSVVYKISGFIIDLHNLNHCFLDLLGCSTVYGPQTGASEGLECKQVVVILNYSITIFFFVLYTSALEVSKIFSYLFQVTCGHFFEGPSGKYFEKVVLMLIYLLLNAKG